jgi:hypothetical protein
LHSSADGPIVDAARQAVPSDVDLARLGLSALAGAVRPLFPEWAGSLPPASFLHECTGGVPLVLEECVRLPTARS